MTDLLNSLGGNTATTLTNSVVDKDLAIDHNLATFSIFSLTLSGLTGLNSVDQVIFLNGSPQGEYVVFGVAFPVATLELSLLRDVYVKTYLGSVQQEQLIVDVTSLDLLGAVGAVGPRKAFLGFKATKPYERAVIAIATTLLSADVGEAMHVHEFCTEGRFVTP